MQKTFVEVVLPLSLPKNYTYEIPEEWVDSLSVGQRVIVQFGKKRFYTALILNIHNLSPKEYNAKPISSILDEKPIVNDHQLELWKWMTDYYLCHLGDVMNAALPAGLKLASETKIILRDPSVIDHLELDDKEYLVAEAISIQKELSIREIQEILDQKTVFPVIKSLLNKGILFLREELQEGYKPKMESFISLGEAYENKDERKQLFDELERAPKQMELLLKFYQIKNKSGEVRKAELAKAAGKNYSVIAALVRKGIFLENEREVGRLHLENLETITPITLSEKQLEALTSIREQFVEKDVVLLHGVTSSGKTEIYAELIKHLAKEKKQVLYLLPEIALKAQLIARLKKFFGNTVGIYHSKFSPNERVEIWEKVLNNEYKIILGARSALFLPFQDLSLVIVDEEHDPSYKQFDPAPRYNARDSAIFLASLHKAKTLLGSATPSIESYHNTDTGKYGLVNLTERFGNIQLPKIKVADITRSARIKSAKSHLTETLVKDLQQVLENKEQAIIFRNRRGYAPMLTCGTCGFTPQCKNCDVSLTYHKIFHDLRCHYCGYKTKLITVCPACGAHNMQVQGFGTEKIEDEINLIFDNIKVARMDFDAVRTKHGHDKVIKNFEAGKTDVLVGTQMVTKGLDFENVALVAVLNSDQLLYYPDFRANERAFQLMVQVAGRAGRKNRQGEVIIQARDISHPVLRYVIQNDFEAFYLAELSQRKKFKYPPFVRLIHIHMKHRDKETLHKAAQYVYQLLLRKIGNRAYQPTVPSISRIRNFYLIDILIKIEKNKSKIISAKEAIRETMAALQDHKDFRTVVMYADVDPY